MIAQLAGRAHGVVTRAERLSAGVSSASIGRRVERGALIPVHRGVYRVGHCAWSIEASYLAAVRACGERALLSGLSAAHLYELVKRAPERPEVTVPSDRYVDGVASRRSRRIDPRDVTTWSGIPTTTIPRTLVDIAGVLTPEQLGRAWHEASVRHRTSAEAVEAALKRRGHAVGAATLRAAVFGRLPVTLSALEARFLERLREAALPLPQTNRAAGGRRVDCRWPDRGVTVELDGYRYHRTRHVWEQDRARERQAYARGDELRRYTYADVFERPGPMLAELRPLLAGPDAGSGRAS